MGRDTHVKIAELLVEYEDEIVNRVISFYDDPEAAIINPHLVFSPAVDRERHDALLAALRILHESGLLQDSSFGICPECGEHNAPTAMNCSACTTQFDTTDEAVEVRFQFEKKIPITRDVRWLILIHGMNSTGNWQQYFSWRISNTYGYAIPVSIFKYGVMRIGVLFKWRVSQIADVFEEHIEDLLAEMQSSGFGPPDLIAHSLGTRILGEVLARDNNIRLSRVIVCGSILPQDYDWGGVIGKKVDHILNHQGGRDLPVRVARFCIPGSGPSGVHGFTDNRVMNVRSPDYAHSDFLKADSLASSLGSGGIWRRFFTAADPDVTLKEICELSEYRQGNRILNDLVRNIIRIIILTIMVAASLRLSQYIFSDIVRTIESVF